MNNAQNKLAVERLLAEVWTRGETAPVAELIGDSYTIFHDPGDPWEGQTLDRAGYIERLTASRAPFPDQRFTIEALIAEQDKVAVTWTWAGTHLRPVAGIPASGRVIRMSGATIYSFAGAGIVGHWQIVDRLGVFQQLSAR